MEAGVKRRDRIVVWVANRVLGLASRRYRALLKEFVKEGVYSMALGHIVEVRQDGLFTVTHPFSCRVGGRTLMDCPTTAYVREVLDSGRMCAPLESDAAYYRILRNRDGLYHLPYNIEKEASHG
jgi:hypothetical protein